MRWRCNPFLYFVLLAVFGCADERPYLSGHVKRAYDAVLTTCDPYNQSALHSCVVFSAAFQESLYVYDATAGEMVLAPMSYFPLKIKVGRATEELAVVKSEDRRFPFMLAYDRAQPAIYPVRLFPSSDKKEPSFVEPTPEALKKAPFSVAAAQIDKRVVLALVYSDEARVEFLALDEETGKIDTKIAPVSTPVGTKPGVISIDEKRTVAVIADEGENNIHVVDLSNISQVLSHGAALKIRKFDVGMKVRNVYLSRRDFGAGEHVYALLLQPTSNEIKIVDIDSSTPFKGLALDESPIAGYFPDKESATCCKGEKNWVSVATIKGNLFYISIKNASGALSLEKASTVDLKAENNLALTKLYIRKIIGGTIEQDKKIKREKLCSSNRETFFIASYGNNRSSIIESDLGSDPVEVEAHGYSCEGEDAASLFGKPK